MGKTLDLGRRIELNSMDWHCSDISIGLYEHEDAAGTCFVVHTYSSAAGADERLAFIRSGMEKMIGLVADGDKLRFACGTLHLRALKRAFLDLCRKASNEPLEALPMTAFDKKADGELTIRPEGQGVYEIISEDGSEKGSKRAEATARGFAKLCEMERADETPSKVTFPCGQDHHELMAMLMFRAQNVRASMQEEEQAASRGTLAAPSQQN